MYTTDSPFIGRLKEKNDELISFYVAETKSVLTERQRDDLSKIDVEIDESGKLYYRVFGRYDWEDIITELETLIEETRNSVLGLSDLLEQLLRILRNLLEVEFPVQAYSFAIDSAISGEPFTIPRYEYPFKTIQSLNNSLKEIIDEMRKKLKEGHWPKETRKTIEDYLKKVAGRKRVYVLCGIFSPSTGQIILYESAIQNWLPSVDYFKKLLDVYSHELFHAFHYVHMKTPKRWKYDGDGVMTVESLASFIEYRYGMHHICETAISAGLISAWNDYDMHDFPYAGAKYIDRYPGLCELMFKDSVVRGTKSAFDSLEIASRL